MFISGITRVDGIISEEQRLHIKNVILAKQQTLRNETDGDLYKDSYGGTIDEVEAYFDHLTPIIEDITKLKLQKENSYSRIYNVGSTLNRHLDREGLEITVSIQIENTTGLTQPIYAQNYSGGINDAGLYNRDCLLIKGRDLEHWRMPIQSANPQGVLINVFFHWNIVKGEILEVDLLEPSLCDTIISEAEALGFARSEVLGFLCMTTIREALLHYGLMTLMV
jgi:hypothetical protein